MTPIIANYKHLKKLFTTCRLGTQALLCASLILSCGRTLKITKPDRQKQREEKLNFDRSSFGNSPLLFWYHLTEFEKTALQNADKAKKGDPDALFALAIFASGNVRDMATYNAYHKRVLDFIKSIQPGIKKKNKVKEKGKVLYDAMCKEFFKQRITDKALKGYRFNQSQLTKIFRTEKFNCISSSLLFIVLARYFDFTAKGVHIPSHTFVQLETPDGEIIEIETTIKSGYDKVHDRAFYEQKGKGWYSKRGLEQSTYEDYLRREIAEPYEVICFNMNNQHTGYNRMSALDRNRLLEGMGFVRTNDSYSQDSRLIVYNKEFNNLKDSKDYATLGRMFDKIHPLLPKLRKTWSANPEVNNHLLLIEYQYALTLLNTGKENQAVENLTELLTRLDSKLELYNLLIKNSIAIIGNYSKQLIKEKKFTECLTLLNTFTSPPQIVENLQMSYDYLYESWASVHWGKKEWFKAIEKNEKALSFAKTQEDTNRIQGNTEGAYSNWASTLANAGKKEEARKVLKQCIKNCPKAKTCRKNLRILSK